MEARTSFIGGSDVAALFGLSPWVTPYELYQRKTGTAAANPSSERMEWGLRLEEPIAAATQERTQWDLHSPDPSVIPHPSIRGMAGTPDRLINGDGVLEIKTVDRLYYKNWKDGEPPLHYQLQLQHYLACSGRDWGAFAVLVGGNELAIKRIERHDGAIKRIEEAVEAFWNNVKEGNAPAPDPTMDHAAIQNMVFATTQTQDVVDLTKDGEAFGLMAKICKLDAQAKLINKHLRAAKDALILKAPDASKIKSGQYLARLSRMNDNPGKAITPEMVGQIIGARKGSVRLSVKEEQHV